MKSTIAQSFLAVAFVGIALTANAQNTNVPEKKNPELSAPPGTRMMNNADAPMDNQRYMEYRTARKGCDSQQGGMRDSCCAMSMLATVSRIQARSSATL